MIVTKSWLSEFIDLSDVSNETLYETFNAIGLEVDSIKSYEIPSRVVVGKIVSCQKHPDADKLSLCQIDVGSGTRQIVCGAANVVDAQYVAVALVGAVLPGNFEIKPAKLRGVDSDGMVCASSELGLPEMGKGIMILDESIGELEVGRELGSYEKIADTVIELELTANRGDCLSIYGVARDLGVALDRELRSFEYKTKNTKKIGISRFVDLHMGSDIEADLHYKLTTVEKRDISFLIRLRLTMVEIESKDKLSDILSYATHTTGVILRAYAMDSFYDGENKIILNVDSKERGIVSISIKDHLLSTVGVNQDEKTLPTEESELVLFESSYIHPDLLVDALSTKDYEKDEFYYKTSRGSESSLLFGLEYLFGLLEIDLSITTYSGHLSVTSAWEPTNIALNANDIRSIIGKDIETSKITSILRALKFEIHSSQNDNFSVVVPRFRHDIKNIQDITEEIVRIVGINNIESKPLSFVESNRLTPTTDRYSFKRDIRNSAVSAGLYENISYIFSDRSKLKRYGFELVRDELDLTNPIAEDLNTLRTTLLINLLDATKRNVNYTQKSIGLFEIGAIFDANREQREVLSLIWSGQDRVESVANSGKPEMISFESFVEKLGSIIGSFELVESMQSNGLIHPYQVADIIYRGQKCGYVSKLHPVAQEDFGIYDTFIAQIDIDNILPIHIDAKPISKFQGVYKDLSIVIDREINYTQISQEISSLDIDLLKRYYPIDIYEDEELGDQKSLTIRLYIQSMERTLKDSDIDEVISPIMERLEQVCQATLR